MVEGRWSFGSREADGGGDEWDPCFGGELNESMGGSGPCFAAEERFCRKVDVGVKSQFSALGIRGRRNSPYSTYCGVQS